MAKSGEGEVGILRVLEAGLGQPWPSSWSVFLPEPHLCPRGDLPSQPASPLSLTSSHPTLRRTELPQQMPGLLGGPAEATLCVGADRHVFIFSQNHLFHQSLV